MRVPSLARYVPSGVCYMRRAHYSSSLPPQPPYPLTPLPPRPAPRYVNQIWDLYEDFHVVLMPLLNHEVRGSDKLESFSEHLVDAEDEVEDVE